MDWNDGHKKACTPVVAAPSPPTSTRPSMGAAATPGDVGHQDSTAVRVPQAMSAVAVKLYMQGKIYKIPAVGSMLDIEQYVKSKLVTAAPFSLSYVDEDRDVITLTSDAEFQEAARCARAANGAQDQRMSDRPKRKKGRGKERRNDRGEGGKKGNS